MHDAEGFWLLRKDFAVLAESAELEQLAGSSGERDPMSTLRRGKWDRHLGPGSRRDDDLSDRRRVDLHLHAYRLGRRGSQDHHRTGRAREVEHEGVVDAARSASVRPLFAGVVPGEVHAIVVLRGEVREVVLVLTLRLDVGDIQRVDQRRRPILRHGADGAVQDRLVQAVDGQGNPLFQRDGQGNLILDANGDPIPVLVTINVSPVLSVDGANASAGFFSLFATGGSHAGRLSDSELKLLSEWIDVGGQYYNNPFDVPQ